MKVMKMCLTIFIGANLSKTEEVGDYDGNAPNDNPCEKKKCERRGGIWEHAGIMGYMRCTIPYCDGGKACSSSAECHGLCIVDDYDGVPYCQYNDNPFGCYGIVNGPGEQIDIICVD